MVRVLSSLTVIAIMIASASVALALLTRVTDDWCTTAGGDPHFFPAGPAQYWNVSVGSGYNNCHMWTTTWQGVGWVNRAEWYTDPTDPSGNGNVQAFMPNQHNSCGVVTYQVLPNGDTGSVFSVAVNQQQSGWAWVYSTLMYPNEGAKMFLPDGQSSCAGGNSMSVDAALWNLGL